MTVLAIAAAAVQVFEGTLQNPQLIWDMATRSERLQGTLMLAGNHGSLKWVHATYAGASPNAAGQRFRGTVRLQGVLTGTTLDVTGIL